MIFRKVSRSFFDAVAERTSHIVAVIMSGRPLDIRKIAEKSQAVLLAWRPGTMGAELSSVWCTEKRRLPVNCQ